MIGEAGDEMVGLIQTDMSFGWWMESSVLYTDS